MAIARVGSAANPRPLLAPEHLVGRDDLGDDSPGKRLVGPILRPEHIHSNALAYPRSLGTSEEPPVSGTSPTLTNAGTKPAESGDAQVARTREREARPGGRAVDGGDHRLLEPAEPRTCRFQRARKSLPTSARRRGALRGPARRRSHGPPREDDGADVRIGRLLQRSHERLVRRRIERVQLVRPVQCDRQDRALASRLDLCHPPLVDRPVSGSLTGWSILRSFPWGKSTKRRRSTRTRAPSSRSPSSSLPRSPTFAFAAVRGGRRAAGGGSGVVVTPDGFMLTSAHVVAARTAGRGLLRRRREFSAEVVGADPLSDLAVLRADTADLAPADPRRRRDAACRPARRRDRQPQRLRRLGDRRRRLGARAVPAGPLAGGRTDRRERDPDRRRSQPRQLRRGARRRTRPRRRHQHRGRRRRPRPRRPDQRDDPQDHRRAHARGPLHSAPTSASPAARGRCPRGSRGSSAARTASRSSRLSRAAPLRWPDCARRISSSPSAGLRSKGSTTCSG